MTMAEIKARTLADGLGFLEGPRWHEGTLYVSDMARRVVLAIDADGRAREIVAVPHAPSGLGFLPDGTLLVASMHDATVYRVEDGGLAVHADLAGHLAGPINDMVVDAKGRAYVGSFGFDHFKGEPPAPSGLALVDTHATARRVADDLAFPNGMVVTPDGSTLIVAESRAQRLTAFDIDPDGGLSNRRLHADVAPHYPDGICLDRQGGIWAASFERPQVIRVDATGTITDTVHLSARRGVACVLGGEDGRRLFCLSSPSGWTEISHGEGVGRIEYADVAAGSAGSP